jgi:hypothetical protein
MLKYQGRPYTTQKAKSGPCILTMAYHMAAIFIEYIFYIRPIHTLQAGQSTDRRRGGIKAAVLAARIILFTSYF